MTNPPIADPPISSPPSASSSPPSPDKKEDRDHISTVAKGFVAVVGILYATGFLIVFTFLNRIGLQDTGNLLKSKYLYVGVMYYICTIIILVPIFAIVYHHKRLKELHNLKRGRKLDDGMINFLNNYHIIQKIYYPGMLTTMLWLYIFSVVAFFTPSSILHDHYLLLIFNFFPLFIMSLIMELVKSLRSKDKESGTNRLIVKFFWLNFIFMLSLLIYDVYIFWSVVKSLSKMVILEGGIFYIFLVACLGLYIYRSQRHIQSVPDKKLNVSALMMSGCLLFVLYYFSILTFSLHIYNYIPSNKGGGDYTFAPNVTIIFKDNKCPTEIRCTENRSNLVKMIEESEESIFVTDSNNAILLKQRAIHKLPIYEVRRKGILSIIYSD